ncbi:MAG: hypothetical protein LIO44_07760 [Eubacterium sp.]|nr:hypothetical protein [Eubacterium sp.]
MNEKKFTNLEDFLKIMASMQELESESGKDSLDEVIEDAVSDTLLSEDELEFVFAAKSDFIPDLDDEGKL